MHLAEIPASKINDEDRDAPIGSNNPDRFRYSLRLGTSRRSAASLKSRFSF
jgi:hypothetical protein